MGRVRDSEICAEGVQVKREPMFIDEQFSPEREEWRQATCANWDLYIYTLQIRRAVREFVGELAHKFVKNIVAEMFAPPTGGPLLKPVPTVAQFIAMDSPEYRLAKRFARNKEKGAKVAALNRARAAKKLAKRRRQCIR